MLLLVWNSYSQLNKEFISLSYEFAPTNASTINYSNINIQGVKQYRFKNIILSPAVSINKTSYDILLNDYLNYSVLDNVYSFKINPGITYNLTNKLAFKGVVGVSANTNLEHKLTAEDILYTGSFATSYFFKENLSSYLSLGVAYDVYNGKPSLLPKIEYYTNINKFEVTLGYPITKFAYNLNKDSALFLRYKNEGNYYHLSNTYYNFSQEQVGYLEYHSQKIDLGYTHNMGKKWSVNFSGGYMYDTKLDLLTTQEKLSRSLQLENQIFFTTGIKYNFSEK